MQKVEKPNKKTVENQSAESKNDKIGGLLFQISDLNIIIYDQNFLCIHCTIVKYLKDFPD